MTGLPSPSVTLMPRRAKLSAPTRPARSASCADSIPELESLRGIAIALVFLMHAEGQFNGVRAFAGGFSPWRGYILGGYTGVSLFFILSGFLLSRPFLVEATGGRQVSRGLYYARRALRILPLYWVVVVTATVLCASTATDLLRGVPFLLFLNSIEGTTVPLRPFSFVWWSLATEAQFYLVLPLLPFVLGSRRGRRVGVAVLVIYAISYAAFATGMFHMATTRGQYRLVHSFLGRAPLFAFGILAASVYQRFGDSLKAWASSVVWLRRGGADLLLFAVLLCLGLLLRRIVPGNYFTLEPSRFAWHLPEGALWAAVLLLLLLAPLRSKFLFSNRILATLGLLSYSIYLVHVPLLFFELDILRSTLSWTPEGWSLASVGACALLTAACLGISALTYALIERPMLRRKARLGVWGGAQRAPRPVPTRDIAAALPVAERLSA